MSAHEGVTADNAREIGENILSSMVGESVEEFKFRKCKQAVNLNSKSVVKVRGEVVKVDPQLIFQRLITVGERCDDLQSLFKYELCSHQPALFESSTLQLQANKAALADVL